MSLSGVTGTDSSVDVRRDAETEPGFDANGGLAGLAGFGAVRTLEAVVAALTLRNAFGSGSLPLPDPDGLAAVGVVVGEVAVAAEDVVGGVIVGPDGVTGLVAVPAAGGFLSCSTLSGETDSADEGVTGCEAEAARVLPLAAAAGSTSLDSVAGFGFPVPAPGVGFAVPEAVPWLFTGSICFFAGGGGLLAVGSGFSVAPTGSLPAADIGDAMAPFDSTALDTAAAAPLLAVSAVGTSDADAGWRSGSVVAVPLCRSAACLSRSDAAKGPLVSRVKPALASFAGGTAAGRSVLRCFCSAVASGLELAT